MTWIILFVIIIAIAVVLHYTKKSDRDSATSVKSSPEMFEFTVKIGSKAEISNDFLIVEGSDYFGPCDSSQNGQYILSWSDFDPKSGIGGARKKGYGRYVFVKDSKVVLIGQLERPDNGKVSDNGIFMINDLKFSEESSQTVYIFSPSGDILMEQDSYIGLSISHNGDFALCLQCRRDSEYYNNDLAIADIETKSFITHFKPIVKKAKGYRFDRAKHIVYISYDHGIEHRYNFEGSFLDEDRWEKDRLQLLSGYELFEIAEKDQNEIDSNELKSFSRVIELLENALQKGVSENTQARIHRYLGEIYHRCNSKEKSLKHLKAALDLNPKVGVKKLYETLKKE